MILFNLRKMGIDPKGPAATVLAGYDKAMKDAEEEYVAVHYLRHLNVKRHGSLLTHLQNQFTLGTDKYRKTLTAAYNLSIKWKSEIEERSGYQKRFVPLEGVSLATDVNGGDHRGRDMSKVKCYFCNEMGHIATNCPKKKKKQEEKKAKEIAATTTTDDTSTIGTQPTIGTSVKLPTHIRKSHKCPFWKRLIHPIIRLAPLSPIHHWKDH